MNQPRRAGTAGEEKVGRSKSGEANELIAMLREVAIRLGKLGDAYEALKVEHEWKCQQVASMEEHWALTESHEETFEEWQELLLNFKSEIVDRDELLAGTVGR